jgi:hypothetical protein
VLKTISFHTKISKSCLFICLCRYFCVKPSHHPRSGRSLFRDSRGKCVSLTALCFLRRKMPQQLLGGSVNSEIWYKCEPMGVNTLGKLLSNACKKAGIKQDHRQLCSTLALTKCIVQCFPTLPSPCCLLVMWLMLHSSCLQPLPVTAPCSTVINPHSRQYFTYGFLIGKVAVHSRFNLQQIQRHHQYELGLLLYPRNPVEVPTICQPVTAFPGVDWCKHGLAHT